MSPSIRSWFRSIRSVGRRRGTKTFLSSAAAIADAEPAEFCGYQSPLTVRRQLDGSGVGARGPCPTTLPVKFKLEALV